jgi:hypothetical protein
MKLKIANGDIGEAQRDPWVSFIFGGPGENH